MKLRRMLLYVAGAATLVLALGLVAAQCINVSVYSRSQAAAQLSLANRACVDRLDAVLQIATTQARILAQTEAAPLLHDEALIPSEALWRSQQPGMHAFLLDKNGRVVHAASTQLEGQEIALEPSISDALKSGRTLVIPQSDTLWPDNGSQTAAVHPVLENGAYLGCIMVTVEMDTLVRIVQETGSTLGGTVALFDGNGRVVATSGSAPYDTLLDLMNKSNFRNFMQPDQPFFFRMRGTEFVATYFALKMANWNLLCSMDPQQRTIGAYWHILPMSVVFFAVLILGLSLNAVVRRYYSVPMALLQTSIKSIEAGDYSHSVPYLGKLELGDVGEAFNAMLARIRRDHTELGIKEARHRIVNEQSNSIIFEYNMESETVQCSPNGRMLANYPACMERFPDVLVANGCVNPTEGKRLVALVSEMKRGRKTGEMELQLRTYNDKLCWFHLRLSTIADTTSLKPLRVVGKLTDIDESKRESQHLAYKAERDALTGLYNKETTHLSIVQRLATRADSRISALFVADLDNFKRVNDGYGHQKGDEILAQVAQVVQACMGPTDIVGRMGGDEFMFLMSDVDNVAEVERAAQRLVDEVRTVILDEAKGDFMSLSVGIALCPQDGVTYQQLYAHADNAAYAAKRTGKNDYAFYREGE